MYFRTADLQENADQIGQIKSLMLPRSEKIREILPIRGSPLAVEHPYRVKWEIL